MTNYRVETGVTVLGIPCVSIIADMRGHPVDVRTISRMVYGTYNIGGGFEVQGQDRIPGAIMREWFAAVERELLQVPA